MNTETSPEVPVADPAPQASEDDPKVLMAKMRAEFEALIESHAKGAAEDLKNAVAWEREQCAKVCEKYGGSMIGQRLAANIRKRGK